MSVGPTIPELHPSQAIALAEWRLDPRTRDAVLVYEAPDGRAYRLGTVAAVAWMQDERALDFFQAHLLRRARDSEDS